MAKSQIKIVETPPVRGLFFWRGFSAQRNLSLTVANFEIVQIPHELPQEQGNSKPKPSQIKLVEKESSHWCEDSFLPIDKSENVEVPHGLSEEQRNPKPKWLQIELLVETEGGLSPKGEDPLLFVR